MENINIQDKKTRQRIADQKKYFKDADKSRRIKIIQKISKLGTIPTEASITKYDIKIEELLKIKEYLVKIKDIEIKDKINTKVFKRIEFINLNKIDLKNRE
tara:strand:- start:368 stop:670 length:303 start_codon:yes stop_codon:yes gene_type:complete